jgi:ribosomal protein L37AE/L43A
MIGLSVTSAAMLYLCLTLAVLFGVWFYQHYRAKAKKITLAEEILHICEYCHFAYLARGSKKITKCPQCSSYNKSSHDLKK